MSGDLWRLVTRVSQNHKSLDSTSKPESSDFNLVITRFSKTTGSKFKGHKKITKNRTKSNIQINRFYLCKANWKKLKNNRKKYKIKITNSQNANLNRRKINIFFLWKENWKKFKYDRKKNKLQNVDLKT